MWDNVRKDGRHEILTVWPVHQACSGAQLLCASSALRGHSQTDLGQGGVHLAPLGTSLAVLGQGVRGSAGRGRIGRGRGGRGGGRGGGDSCITTTGLVRNPTGQTGEESKVKISGKVRIGVLIIKVRKNVTKTRSSILCDQVP